MKALIIDDERLARRELNTLLQAFSNIEVIGEAVNAEEAYDKIQKLNPDVLFLDIQMPGKNGFELLEMLDSVPRVIFTTAFDEYAIKAFEVNALDYLMKPIQPERLADSIQKLMKEESREEKKSTYIRSRKLTPKDQVFVKDGEKCWFVKLTDVRYFESDGNYIKVYFDKFRPMIHKSLNALEERLDEKSFFRASRKHIINLEWVEKIDTWFNGGLIVLLKGGDKIEVSRRQSSRFKDLMSL
jgi:two-component system LytT family response regulator